VRAGNPLIARGVYEFGEFRLNTLERSVESAGHPLALAPKAMAVLVVLVENRGRIVDRDQLMRLVWPDTFVEDNTLAFNISVLRKMFGESGTSPRFIETVPKRGYRFIAEVREVVADEPEPLTATEPAVAEAEIPKSTFPRRALPRLAMAGLLVAIAVLAAWRVVPRSDTPASLAVLPFRALDAASADDSLEVGLTDALITRLSRSLSIPVRPMTAVLPYRGRTGDPVSVGRALRVDAILEGTFQEHGRKIRSSVRLLRTRDGKVLYAAVFDQQIDELFRLQDALSLELSEMLVLKLAPPGHTPGKTTGRDPVAYAAYLKGRSHWNQRTSPNLHRAIDYFHEAIAADPADALAYAGLADAYLLLPSAERMPNSSIMPLARAAAERAVQLDAGLAEPHASLGLLALNYDLDWAAAEREFAAAIRLNPYYSTARHWYAEYLGSMGRMQAAEAEFERARAFDPLSAAIPADEAKIFWYDRQFEKSAALARQSLSLDPHFALAHLMLGASLLELGDCGRAMAEVSAPAIVHESDTALAVRIFVYQRCGSQAEAFTALKRLKGEDREDGTPFMVAAGYAAVGDSEHAQEWLERSVAEREFGIVSLRSNPVFDGVRSGARFQELLTRLRLK
jgi:DNA-binding winged helix-turn-helix (wHTH) protein/TolB-like protein/tetratricopeptide (TPR) repeat protein